MARLFAALLVFALPLAAQLKDRDQEKSETAVIVEEDEDLAQPAEYVFNPIQAGRDLRVGDFYAKRGNHRAAAGRYLEATKWNPGFAEAYFKLARSREKLNQPEQALEAYQKYLALDANGENAREARKRLQELEAKREKLPLADQAGKEQAGKEPPPGQGSSRPE
jgi:tetratricopeptide (TPR) repeat protein